VTSPGDLLIDRVRVRAITRVYADRDDWCLMAEHCLKRLGIPWNAEQDTSTEPVLMSQVREIAERLGRRYDMSQSVQEALHELEQVPYSPNEC
jgi:hypothetical protein